MHLCQYALPWRSGLTYGLLGFPLAFAALPLYVVLPNHYARSFGLSLATVGALLMAVRLVDAVVEPWLGVPATHCLPERPAQCGWWAALRRYFSGWA